MFHGLSEMNFSPGFQSVSTEIYRISARFQIYFCTIQIEFDDSVYCWINPLISLSFWLKSANNRCNMVKFEASAKVQLPLNQFKITFANNVRNYWQKQKRKNFLDNLEELETCWTTILLSGVATLWFDTLENETSPLVYFVIYAILIHQWWRKLVPT